MHAGVRPKIDHVIPLQVSSSMQGKHERSFAKSEKDANFMGNRYKRAIAEYAAKYPENLGGKGKCATQPLAGGFTVFLYPMSAIECKFGSMELKRDGKQIATFRDGYVRVPRR